MRRMLESLTLKDFLERVGEEFRVAGPGAPVVLALIEATDLSRPNAPGPRRSPFSLVFRGPFSPVMTQRTYALEHAALGRLEIFLVPIGPDADGMRYEAVFN
jgi:uncharacterized protein DUF6916